MITNEKQYRSTKASIEKLEGAVAALEAPTDNFPEVFAKAQRSALRSQIDELAEDVRFYDDLRAGKISAFSAESLHDLPDILIQARIARGMSQKDLGDFLGVAEQQIQRYESDRYRMASLDRLTEVADALNVRINERAQLVGSPRLDSVDPSVWRAFPLAEMYKRGWFEDFSGTLSQAKKAAGDLIPAFLHGPHSQFRPMALHRKSVRSNGQVHEAAISAWEARVRTLADRNPPAQSFDRDRITADWVRGLVALSLDDRGPRLAVDYLRDAGISLVIERHLPGTLLDGAALASSDHHAIVAMTLRHDRLDNFWFSLLHEIGHLTLHIRLGEYAAIFDDNDSPATDKVEQDADYFAQEALIPEANWSLAVSRFTQNEKAVLTDAKRFGVAPAVIAGRVRRDAGDYTLLRTMVGSGEVRRQFGL
ncbi:MAG: ImmA/IrrE family metallo-endopeptidase [Phenylobacterium sp.]|jgi:HTH-type transcriptional regulator/antitoxin HigA|uniref:XRE family transcriptional regulator n=1 Tax=Phenylobacterium sp. TaxID=1871053 RepID=UPI0025FC5679|nr:XRE family transcriptional regulator [Phenylobacterium sp.]MCA3758746.1 ImmA/IrrE family metallo-endopeptidase [Phenylobacterium sp.]MCA6246483.1 ImmA/IrrE family metallo-endopeptidase [Phenylobacterium sp.]